LLRASTSPSLPQLTAPAEILARVTPTRPRQGGAVPADLARRLGTAHVSGRYHFTSQPFLLEGAQRVHDLGYGAIKLWFASIERAYRFNSEWALPKQYTYTELAQHPYFRAAFDLPFSVFALELYPAGVVDSKGVGLDLLKTDEGFAADEAQCYELTKYLLTTYRDRDVTFLLQNWEGDWMLRGSARAAWLKGEIPDLPRRIDVFTRWFNARQRGVERARSEITGTRCQVFHAVEVNKVLDALQGMPTLTTHVLPHIRPDFISWSCYDGLKTDARDGDKTAVGLWQGLELIQHYARTTQVDAQGRPAVYIGEIGVPEEIVPAAATLDILDAAMGVFFARDIPYILHWELYCNERKDGNRDPVKEPETAGDLRGFWLVRPDGSLGHTAEYFQQLLQRAAASKTPGAR